MSDAALIPQLLNRLRMRQVALILAVGEHGTLRKASAELGMTQPAATKMIQELESALGQRLFERVGRGQKLTPAGDSVLRYFRGMRGSVESMTRELAQAAQFQLGESESLAAPDMPDSWSSNAAELREDGGIEYWYVGLITPKNGYIGVSQGFDADERWVSGQLDSAAATGVEQIDGREWTVYDHRDGAGETGRASCRERVSVVV